MEGIIWKIRRLEHFLACRWITQGHRLYHLQMITVGEWPLILLAQGYVMTFTSYDFSMKYVASYILSTSVSPKLHKQTIARTIWKFINTNC